MKRPIDDEFVGYTCADCGDMRAWENVELVAHPDDEQNRFPICLERECSITEVQLPK